MCALFCLFVVFFCLFVFVCLFVSGSIQLFESDIPSGTGTIVNVFPYCDGPVSSLEECQGEWGFDPSVTCSHEDDVKIRCLIGECAT